jgi:copper homeostasis protein
MERMSRQSEVLIEVCAGSVADVSAAMAVGADRIELCAALELGGVTPSTGIVEAALEASRLPVIVMLRPRAGGFCYDDDEFKVMLRDASRFLDLGVAGVAFGVLNRRQRVDVARAREIIDGVKPREAVFHRAFDLVADRLAALTELIEIGCTRVLTSGGQATAVEGINALRDLVDLGGSRIEIMPGGGIRADNIREIVRQTKCRQIHLGASAPVNDCSLAAQSSIQLSDARYMAGSDYKAVDRTLLTAAVEALRTRAV